MFALLAALALAAPPPVVWVEGESAVQPHPAFKVAGWGRDVLSGGRWLFAVVDPGDIAKSVPADGLTIKYPLTTAAGVHSVHARVGFEFARSPFDWRIDGGAWHRVSPDTYTTDLQALADFAEVAWLDLGPAELAAGRHTLEFHVPRPAKKGDRLVFGLDCVCVTPGPFRPNGKVKPGDARQSPLDQAAAGVVFDFPAAGPEPGARRTASLAGTWQVARFDEPGELVDRAGPVAALPADLDALAWRGVKVPASLAAEIPEWEYCHRYLYRTRLRVPADLAGRAVVVRFPNNALLSTVFVNEVRAGFSDTPCAAFDCDLTAAVKVGQINDLVVCVKDLYYAVAKTPGGKSARTLFNYPPAKFLVQGGLGPTKYADFPTLYKVRRAGILEAPAATAAGRVYAADVFVMPSVADESLKVRVTVRNPTAAAATAAVAAAVRPAAGGGVAKELPAVPVAVPAGGEAVVTLAAGWADPVVWWPDAPHLYAVETVVNLDGVVIDRVTTEFGFREWRVAGRDFTLNGVPWRHRADLHAQGPWPDEPAALAAVAAWKANGQTMTRYWGEEPLIGGSQAATLSFFDRAGVCVRRSGVFDGEVASYQLVDDGRVNAALFANWKKQVAAWVTAERNHPSVFVWSLENEVTYINARNFGWLREVEPEMKAAVTLVTALDPTRPAMLDGGDALTDQSLPVAGNHYLETDKRAYPDEAYTFDRAYSRHRPGKGGDPWPVPRDKPVFLGESFFAAGSPPAAYAEVMGEAAFLGRTAAGLGVSRFARVLSEGYRWHGVAAFHFWFDEGAGRDHHRAWQPDAVLCREYDTVFAAGTDVTRTLKVFHDNARTPATFTVHWLLQTTGTAAPAAVRGKRVVTVAPGATETFPVTLAVPPVPAGGTAAGEFVMTLVKDGKEVFRDIRPVRLFGPEPAVAGVAAGAVGLYDPTGKGAALLAGLVEAVPVAAVTAVPAGVRVLVVGPDAVSQELATDPVWTRLALKGVRVVVFDQAHPLHYQAVPTDLDPTPHAGRLAFPDDPGHPALAGLTAADLAGWPGGGRAVYRHAYRKPTRGGRSVVQCDAELGCTALVEVPAGDGVLLLSQLALGDDPAGPAARRVAANLVRSALGYRKAAKTVGVYLPDDPRRAALAAAGVPAEPMLLADGLTKPDIFVVDGSAETVNALARAADQVGAFTKRGGTLMVWGLTPEALADFNKLVGFGHMIRPFRMERVTLAVPRDRLAAGLGLRDVALESAEAIYPWAGDRYPAADTFTHVVDLADPAPFLANPALADGWAKMTNGLTSADSWKFIFYHDQPTQGERPKWTGTFPAEQELTGFSVVVNADYRRLTRVRLTFDGDPKTAVELALKPARELRQDFVFDRPRPCRTFSIEPLAWTAADKAVIGIDNIWLTAKRPADFARRVVPLTTVGGLVRYPAFDGDTPTGGGVVLNQLNIVAREANPDNAAKKRAVVGTLLGNLGAATAGDRVVVPGADLGTTPVPLGEKCDVFLAADKWPGGAPGLAAFPVGDRAFAGVRHAVRDFRTSPLPAAVGVRPGGAVTVAVGRPADALFFLHTAIIGDERAAAGKPVGAYTVTFADGQTAEVPVVLGRSVGHWRAADPRALPGAAVAWAAKAPADATGPDAVVYQMQWTNPRPGVAVTGVAARAPAGGPGTLVLLGLSVGVAK